MVETAKRKVNKVEYGTARYRREVKVPQSVRNQWPTAGGQDQKLELRLLRNHDL